MTPTMADYRELLKGSLDLIVLALIEREPMYGYQMVKEIHARSTGALQMKEGSLYPALHRLERAGLIESSWQRRTDGGDRRYYRLTTHGIEALAARRTTWTSFVAAIEGVLGDGRAAAI
jgi:PadR family transcriptional regulator, regulatory protein PadR